MVVTVQEFESKHGPKLERWRMRARSVKIFKDFGPYVSWKMDTLFEKAIEHNKVPKVVNTLEEAWEEHLIKMEPLIERNVNIMRLVDHVYGHHFRDVLEKMFPGITFVP
jgi:hypothetical protein